MDNRAAILLLALELFAARGYDGVGVQEIVTRAGVTKPTLYHYFGSKNGLLKSILTEYGTRLTNELSEAAFYQGDLSLALARLGKAYFQFANTNGIFCRMQLAMYFAPPESEANRMVRSLNEEQFHMIEELFIRAARHHSNLEGRHMQLAATFIGNINTYIGFALNGYIKLEAELISQIVRQFMYGIYL
jgi:AcrR family transcriptional regulator